MINASVDMVFQAVSNIETFPNIISQTQSVEFVTDKKSGVGTRFRESRTMGKNQMTFELEVTEWRDNKYIRMVNDSHGMGARIRNFLLQGLYKGSLNRHLQAVKQHCEK
ncbi:MAG: SRPBCC family protein [Gammaproteobacteria bacterium]|nr:SRPBCC family protein [Gammaproteobacteria bacterium]